MQVKVTFLYEPEPENVDEDHAMGVTNAEFDRMSNVLIREGAEEIDFEKVED